MNEYSVLYDKKTDNTIFLADIYDIKTAIEMTQEVLGHEIEIYNANVEKDHGTGLEYVETISHEAVVKAKNEAQARDKVTSVCGRNISITDSWILKPGGEAEFMKHVVLNEQQIAVEDNPQLD